MNYYDGLIDRCQALGAVEYIGRTEWGYPIPLVHVGTGRADTLVVGSIHAREHIVTDLIFGIFGGNLPFDVIPCLNIDGVILATEGEGSFGEKIPYLRSLNGGSSDYSLWKANINGVDLNVNFDADWGKGKSNIRYPAPANYVGRYPHSEKETVAVVNLIRRREYSQVVSYHTKGEVIYWGYGDNYYHREEGTRYADSVGYPLSDSVGSSGGLKDWYDLHYDGLGLTVEVGEDRFSHPYPKDKLPELIEKHERSVEIIYDNGQSIRKKLLYGGGS